MDKSTLRKAAILIDSLDPASATVLFSQMTEAQRRLLAEQRMALGDVTAAERQAVVDEFFQHDPAGVARPAEPSQSHAADESVTLELSTAARETEPDDQAVSPDAPSFEFLRETDTETLARHLAAEHPQTIAVVVAHLPSNQAARVLSCLDGDLQTEVVRRLVSLREADPEVVREVERCLARRIDRSIGEAPARVAGVEVVSAILQACDVRTEKNILRNLERHDRRLADLFDATEPCDLADLMRLRASDWSVVLAEIESDVLLLALADSPAELVGRVLQQFSEADRGRMRYALGHLGALRLDDVEAAQHALLELVQELDRQGRIDLARRPLGLAA